MTTAVSLAQQVAPGVSLGFKNRIINGAMMIDQRNAGASVTLNAGSIFTVDRFRSGSNGNWVSAVFSAQQNKGSVTPPTGFINYLGIATTTADSSPASGTAYTLVHPVEGLNISDLAWGTSSAQAVTLSFKVYSNLTGTFGGVVCNITPTRCYPFTFTIASTNTWTSVSVTIPGCTDGTWLTTNNVGMYIRFSLGAGSSMQGTPGAWTGSIVDGATGQQQVCATVGNTFYITGVQLEVGTSATSFEFRDYGRELLMCQRYYEIQYGQQFVMAYGDSGTFCGCLPYKVTKRTTPSITGSATSNRAGGGAFSLSYVTNSGYEGSIIVQTGTAASGAACASGFVTYISAEL